ncbi:MAG: acetyl-CoA C-acetyltransferase [Eubacterium aggregans]|uniref:acetyl-CoA C-acetyltransferase n=1 Tax=Eubacterium aggregans TaxID=81409 RepID=UPI0023F4953C|nr:acetyl-CoA C-acetyltransferase [Eubacterium aggregans]MDD4691550.1 acetyl-CoA C-acetyltransferase [Eubacterium aggregans]MEA5074466.1 acetyl-CoA C-acetyltransferase [Eubacterium aggregans]
MTTEIVLVGAVRTAIGNFGGSLKDVPVTELGSIVIKEAIHRAGIKPEDVDEVLMGCILQAAQGQNVARQAAIGAGLPVTIPAMTLNNLCGSGLKAVNLAASLILSGDAEVVVAGGMENMSRAPYAMPNGRYGYRMGDGTLVDTMINDALTDAFNDYHMGVTAENVAKKYKITREMQDAFAVKSQQKCETAQENGVFDAEIVPIPVKTRGGIVNFQVDELPRHGTNMEKLAKMKPAFIKEGTVTAGTSSGINDGAAAIIVMSAEKAMALNVKPMAKWVVGTSAGVEPEIMGVGPVASCTKAMNRGHLSIDDIDLFEANEAFAAQALAVGKELNIPEEKLNVNGGAIALGHPVGASGTRILVSLLYEMQRRKVKRGLATLCVGGGMGVTTIVEAL